METLKYRCLDMKGLEQIDYKIKELDVFSHVAKSAWLFPSDNLDDVEEYYTRLQITLNELIALISDFKEDSLFKDF